MNGDLFSGSGLRGRLGSRTRFSGIRGLLICGFCWQFGSLSTIAENGSWSLSTGLEVNILYGWMVKFNYITCCERGYGCVCQQVPSQERQRGYDLSLRRETRGRGAKGFGTCVVSFSDSCKQDVIFPLG